MTNLPQNPSQQWQIVTVAGHIGSGKTEVCRKLANLIGWEVVSAGAILRRMAIEHGMNVLEFNEYAKSEPDIDRQIDSAIANLANRRNPVIVDSRLAWHFLRGSLKVFLVVEPAIAAKRVFGATRPDENHTSVENAGNENAERQRVERQRFMHLYSLDCDNWRNYDVVIDTSYIRPEEAACVLAEKLRSARAVAAGPEVWLSVEQLTESEPLGSPEDASATVDITVEHGKYRVVAGHDRVVAAVRASQNLIRCSLVELTAPASAEMSANSVIHG